MDPKIGLMYSESFEGWTEEQKNGYLTAVTSLQHFLQKGKRISLDEKDIEEKAIKSYPSTGERDSGERAAYEQALKDLL